jgi:hypothetical protein
LISGSISEGYGRSCHQTAIRPVKTQKHACTDIEHVFPPEHRNKCSGGNTPRHRHGTAIPRLQPSEAGRPRDSQPQADAIHNLRLQTYNVFPPEHFANRRNVPAGTFVEFAVPFLSNLFACNKTSFLVVALNSVLANVIPISLW